MSIFTTLCAAAERDFEALYDKSPLAAFLCFFFWLCVLVFGSTFVILYGGFSLLWWLQS